MPVHSSRLQNVLDRQTIGTQTLKPSENTNNDMSVHEQTSLVNCDSKFLTDSHKIAFLIIATTPSWISLYSVNWETGNTTSL